MDKCSLLFFPYFVYMYIGGACGRNIYTLPPLLLALLFFVITDASRIDRADTNNVVMFCVVECYIVLCQYKTRRVKTSRVE